MLGKRAGLRGPTARTTARLAASSQIAISFWRTRASRTDLRPNPLRFCASRFVDCRARLAASRPADQRSIFSRFADSVWLAKGTHPLLIQEIFLFFSSLKFLSCSFLFFRVPYFLHQFSRQKDASRSTTDSIFSGLYFFPGWPELERK